jgi:4'-phosphopantetheinyl transferase
MSTAGNTRIIDHFAAESCDITPAAARNAACLLYAPVSDDPQLIDQCGEILSDQERQRAERFAARYDRGHFFQRRAFRRFCAAAALAAPTTLSRITFEETAKGRPYLAGVAQLSFSFSSCRSGLLGAWSSTNYVGVDIENSRGEIEPAPLADRFFSPAEAESIANTDQSTRMRRFLQLWTLKEAALKSVGEGLPYGLDAFEFELEPEPRVVTAPSEHGGAAGFEVHIIDNLGCCAALVIQSPAAAQTTC